MNVETAIFMFEFLIVISLANADYSTTNNRPDLSAKIFLTNVKGSQWNSLTESRHRLHESHLRNAVFILANILQSNGALPHGITFYPAEWMCRSPSTSDDRHVHYLPRNLKLPVTPKVSRGSIPPTKFENLPNRTQFIFGYAPSSGNAADVTGRRPVDSLIFVGPEQK